LVETRVSLRGQIEGIERFESVCTPKLTVNVARFASSLPATALNAHAALPIF